MWQDVAAAIGGGLGGVNSAYRYEREQLNREKVNEIRAELNHMRNMLEVVKEEGRGRRNTENQQGLNDRAAKRETGLNDRFYNGEENKNSRFFTADATTQRGQDMTDARYWDQADRDWTLGYGRLETTQRGQDISSSTARRGQDIGANTARRGQDMLKERTAGGNAMSYAIRAYNSELARRKQSRSLFSTEADTPPTFEEWIQTSGDPEVFPSVQARFGGKPPAARPDQGLSPEDANPDTIAPAPMRATPPAAKPPALPATGPAAAPPAAAPKPPAPVAPRQGSTDGSLIEQQMQYLVNRIRSQEQQTGQRAGELRQELARLRAMMPATTPAAAAPAQ